MGMGGGAVVRVWVGCRGCGGGVSVGRGGVVGVGVGVGDCDGPE